MRTKNTLILLCSALCGYAAEPSAPQPPPSPPQRAVDSGKNTNIDRQIVMAMMASAMLPANSPGHKSWQVRISSTAFDVVSSIEGFRRKSGQWPKSEEIPLPESVKRVTLSEEESAVNIVIEYVKASTFRCQILSDGTIVLPPPYEQMMRSIHNARTSLPVKTDANTGSQKK